MKVAPAMAVLTALSPAAATAGDVVQRLPIRTGCVGISQYVLMKTEAPGAGWVRGHVLHTTVFGKKIHRQDAEMNAQGSYRLDANCKTGQVIRPDAKHLKAEYTGTSDDERRHFIPLGLSCVRKIDQRAVASAICKAHAKSRGTK